MLVIPLIGKRVNTIYYYLGELARINQEIRAELIELAEVELNRRELNKYLRMKSAFI